MSKGTHKFAPLVEYFAESTVACLFMMTQGNALAITVHHLAIASQTGVFASVIAYVTLLASRVGRHWVVASVLAVATAIADFLVHSGDALQVAVEAVMTGLAAALLSLVLAQILRVIRGDKNVR